MRRWLPAPLVGFGMIVLFVLYTILGAVPLLIVGTTGLFFPGTRYASLTKDFVRWVATTWIRANHLNQAFWHGTDAYTFEVPDTLSDQKQYIAVSNHMSWVDMIVIQTALVNHTAMIKFFLKDSLRYLPLVGQVAVFLDMPFMKRYTKAQLEKHPHLRNKDFETTKKAIEHYKAIPLTLLSFVEGTRFTPEKHQRTHSPYADLLAPKAGGLALAIGAFDGRITKLLDITVVYPKGQSSFLGYFCGLVPKVHIDVIERPIPENLQGKNYNDDKEFRAEIQGWMRMIWQEKQQKILEIRDRY